MRVGHVAFFCGARCPNELVTAVNLVATAALKVNGSPVAYSSLHFLAAPCVAWHKETRYCHVGAVACTSRPDIAQAARCATIRPVVMACSRRRGFFVGDADVVQAYDVDTSRDLYTCRAAMDSGAAEVQSEGSATAATGEHEPFMDVSNMVTDDSDRDPDAHTSAAAAKKTERRRLLEKNWDRLTRRFFSGGAVLAAVGLLIEGRGGARLGSKRRSGKWRGSVPAEEMNVNFSPSADWEIQAEGEALRLDSTGGSAPLIDYSKPGPYDVRTALRQEHTCASCFPRCVAGGCLLRISVTYPGRGASSPLAGGQPFPLAIFSGGFLVGMEQYKSYADRLASWGYIVLSYNKIEGVTEPLDDELCAQFITELIDWAGTNPLLRNKIDMNRVYLCGHSRGGKVSVLAAANDPRVAALCLIDPVDNTVYAPLAPGYPSAVAAIRASRNEAEAGVEGVVRRGDGNRSSAEGEAAVQANGVERGSHGSKRLSPSAVDLKPWGGRGEGDVLAGRQEDCAQESAARGCEDRNGTGQEEGIVSGEVVSQNVTQRRRIAPLPIAVVGGEIAGDCAPQDANYRHFFNAAASPSWEVVVKNAGHFQFVDQPTLMQNAVCGFGQVEDADVRAAAHTAMIAWGELMVKDYGRATGSDARQSSVDAVNDSVVLRPSTPFSVGQEPQPDRVWGTSDAIAATVSTINRNVKISSRIKL